MAYVFAASTRSLMTFGFWHRLRRHAVVVGGVSLAILLSASCGGSSGSSGPVTAPTPTSPASPPTVYVNSFWNGTQSHDATSGTMRMTLTQNDSQVTGDVVFDDPVEGDHTGPLSGTVSGNVFAFSFSVGMGGAGCGNALSGTATVGSTTMEGTWSGHNCAGGAISNGRLSLSLPPFESATRFPVMGTWMGNLSPGLGGGASTWTIAQTGDFKGGTLSGSVTVATTNTLQLGSGSLTGTFTNKYPGSSWAVTAETTVTFSGACPTTLMLTWGFNGEDGRTLSAIQRSGTTCRGPVAAAGFNIVRQ